MTNTLIEVRWNGLIASFVLLYGGGLAHLVSMVTSPALIGGSQTVGVKMGFSVQKSLRNPALFTAYILHNSNISIIIYYCFHYFLL